MRASVEAIRNTLSEETEALSSTGSDRLAGLTQIAENILDSFDAIRRRRRADFIYRELVAERVSPERAAVELQALNKRQKGGWLKKKLSG